MTERRQLAYDLLIKGLSNKQIAKRMGISVKSVKELHAFIYLELNLRSGRELIARHYINKYELPRGGES